MDFTLTDEDVQLMLAEIQRFCQRSIGPLVERPERLISTEQLQQLTMQAIEIGLINLEPESAAGLWENFDAQWGRKFSSTALLEVAQKNAGIAFCFHQLAFGAWLTRVLNLEASQRTVVCLQGRYGLARGSLARLLKGKRLSTDDRQLLRDYFPTVNNSREVELLFHADYDWSELLVPVFHNDQELGWALYGRDDDSVRAVPHSHGLNETVAWRWQLSGAHEPSALMVGGDCACHFISAMNINAQALVTIALGALQQGYEKAIEYAATRRQTGKPINQLAAVQLLLANCDRAIQSVELLRQCMAELELTRENLPRVLNLRASAHDVICAAANDVLQVFGGIGYMQETGLEKIVRDCNHLRLLCGTPMELRLFTAEWERES